MANSLDKFRKGVAQWSGNIGSAGISDAVVKTVPLASTSGLPTDTAVMITVNRVDTNGKKTGNYEGIVGVVSGSNLIDCIRGVEGTAQAWTGGTVVEVLHTASNINELIDGILAEHNQDGTHKDTLVTSLKATGAVVNTGTSDVTIVTPKALADSDYAKTTDITVTADSTTTFLNKTFDDELRLKQIATPTNPATGYNKLYFKSDGKLYYLDENSVETEVGAGGGGSIDGWNDASETWEFVSVDDPTGIFRVNADVTGKYSAGMRIKMTNGGNVIYGIITVVNAYGADESGYTYIKFLHQIDPTDSLALYLMANSAITANYYSTQKAPYGFPLEPNKWSIIVIDSTQRTESSPKLDTWYNTGSLSITIPIGCWNVDYQVIARATVGSATNVSVNTTLSTSNNSESDTNFRTYTTTYTTVVNCTVYKGKNLTLTSKTPYYLLIRTGTANVTSIEFRNSDGDMIIRAICSYL